MADESRNGSTVRERTKLLAALMRTPDDRLLDLAEAAELPVDIDPSRMRCVRDILDELAKGLARPGPDPFWARLEGALSQLRGGVQPAAGVPPARLHAAAPPPRRAQRRSVVPEPPVNPDFRHDLMYRARPEGEAARPAEPPPKGWKPDVPGVREPEPGQNDTVTVVLGGDHLARMRAAKAVLTWPLERIAELGAAVASQRERGKPSFKEICRRFQLANEGLVQFTLDTWQRRFEDDAELAREYTRLVSHFRRDYE